ncbi:hypothetical protein PanWU01x14_326230 [Parasponia andersonii]|uniref:Cyclin-dependent protein kinase inhibitor SMR n=1 Tax=Parasponia andersonii TaxID=3476 RepID=A0A2P5AJJ2_PARAD|nr:hypothetical protein PanWU01x14_326230 [Parasponia andersonii]
MGVSNSEMLLSEKDLNVVEFNNFLVRRPTLELIQHERHQLTCCLQDEEDPEVREKQEKSKLEKKEDKFEMLVSTLKLKIPSHHHHVEEFITRDADHDDQENSNGCDNNNNDDGFKTPTSLDNKIPVVLPCPPAPRKPKSTIAKTKRKANRRRVFLDLSSEIESLFPHNVLADLGGKIKKKVRQGSDNIIL